VGFPPPDHDQRPKTIPTPELSTPVHTSNINLLFYRCLPPKIPNPHSTGPARENKEKKSKLQFLFFLKIGYHNRVYTLNPKPSPSLPSPSSLFPLTLSLFLGLGFTRAAVAAHARAIIVEEGRERERRTYLRRGDDDVDDGGARRRRSPGRNFGSLTVGSVKDMAPKT
jgi:hypothetical protein